MASTILEQPSIGFKANFDSQFGPKRANYEDVSGIITFDATPLTCPVETGMSQLDGFSLGQIGATHTVPCYGVVTDSVTNPGTKLITFTGTASKQVYLRYWGIPKL
jgi:hypothetical protein